MGDLKMRVYGSRINLEHFLRGEHEHIWITLVNQAGRVLCIVQKCRRRAERHDALVLHVCV